MESCYKCEVPENRAFLFEVVHPEGIKKVCRKCSFIENFPMIRKKLANDESDRHEIIRTHSKETQPFVKKPSDEEVSLRNLVESNFKKNFNEDLNLKNSLVDNFHWIVMRARRMKHLTQAHLAKELKEPEITIQTIEKGFIPEKSKELITKLEIYLGINIRKKKEPLRKKDEIDFDTLKYLSAADLEEMEEK